MRFASSTSWAAVSRSTLPTSLRKSCSASVETSCASTSSGDVVFLLLGGDDLDLQLVERLVEVVDLAGVEVELVERERDLVRGQRAGLAARLEQVPRLLGFEHRRSRSLRLDHSSRTAHASTPPVKAGQASRSRVPRQPPQKAAVFQKERTDAMGRSAHLSLRRVPTSRKPCAESAAPRYPSVVFGPAARASRSSCFALSTLPSQSRQSPRWKRTLWFFG